MSNIKQETKNRNFRKVKSLNLRSIGDLEELPQGLADLESFMLLKKIVTSGNVFSKDVDVKTESTLLKNRMKLNVQAKASSQSKLRKTHSQKLDKKKSSLKEEAAPAPILIKPVSIYKEWEDVEANFKEKFWENSEEMKGKYHYGVALQGWRKRMEDTVDFNSSINAEAPNMFSVYDGHGGSNCSTFCKNILLRALSKKRDLLVKPKAILQNVFTDVHEEYCKNFKDSTQGSTATTIVVLPVDVDQNMKKGKNGGMKSAAVSDNPKYKTKAKQTTGRKIYNSIRKAASLRENKREYKFYCACVGDSRAVLVYDSGKTVPLSRDHNLRRKDELARIKSSGGEVRYDSEYNEVLVYSKVAKSGLTVTRSIGDGFFKPWVMHLPEIQEGYLTKDAAFFLIASDGLWSHVKTKEIGPILTEYGLEQGIKNLANLSNKRGCYDNCSIVGVDIQKMIATINENI